VVEFYDARFGIGLTQQEKNDLVGSCARSESDCSLLDVEREMTNAFNCHFEQSEESFSM